MFITTNSCSWTACPCLSCRISTKWKCSLLLRSLQWHWMTGHTVDRKVSCVETWTYNLWTQGWSQKIKSSAFFFYLFHFHSIQAQLNLSLIELSTLILRAHLKKPIHTSSVQDASESVYKKMQLPPLPHPLTCSPSLPPCSFYQWICYFWH